MTKKNVNEGLVPADRRLLFTSQVSPAPPAGLAQLVAALPAAELSQLEQPDLLGPRLQEHLAAPGLKAVV